MANLGYLYIKKFFYKVLKCTIVLFYLFIFRCEGVLDPVSELVSQQIVDIGTW